MTEAANAPEPTPAAPTPATPAAAPPPTPEKGASPAPGAIDPATSSEPETPAYWAGDDWRERLAGKDEKEMARLNRVASIEALYKSYREQEKKLSSGMFKMTLPENAGDAEIAQYRKSWGIPEKPDGYGLEIPKIDGWEPGESDRADLIEFATAMHGVHAPPAAVKAATDWYFSKQLQIREQLLEAAQQATINNRATVKAEYGKDTEYNLRLADAELVNMLGEDKAKALTAIPLADGTLLGDNPDFVRYMVQSALANADDGVMATPELSTGGGSFEEQYKAALALADTDPKAYHSPEHQKKLQRLSALKMAREAKSRAA